MQTVPARLNTLEIAATLAAFQWIAQPERNAARGVVSSVEKIEIGAMRMTWDAAVLATLRLMLGSRNG
jgi:hypothetical protein